MTFCQINRISELLKIITHITPNLKLYFALYRYQMHRPQSLRENSLKPPKDITTEKYKSFSSAVFEIFGFRKNSYYFAKLTLHFAPCIFISSRRGIQNSHFWWIIAGVEIFCVFLWSGQLLAAIILMLVAASSSWIIKSVSFFEFPVSVSVSISI